jgi:hypothetical protein
MKSSVSLPLKRNRQDQNRLLQTTLSSSRSWRLKKKHLTSVWWRMSIGSRRRAARLRPVRAQSRIFCRVPLQLLAFCTSLFERRPAVTSGTPTVADWATASDSGPVDQEGTSGLTVIRRSFRGASRFTTPMLSGQPPAHAPESPANPPTQSAPERRRCRVYGAVGLSSRDPDPADRRPSRPARSRHRPCGRRCAPAAHVPRFCGRQTQPTPFFGGAARRIV